jgi:hypothetical protein
VVAKQSLLTLDGKLIADYELKSKTSNPLKVDLFESVIKSRKIKEDNILGELKWIRKLKMALLLILSH